MGVLKYVFANTRVSNKCYLVIEFEKDDYIGSLTFDSLAACTRMSNLFRAHIGHRIEQIGDLDV